MKTPFNQTGKAKPAKLNTMVRFSLAALILLSCVKVPSAVAQSAAAVDDSQAAPPVTKVDLQIVRLAQKILDSPSKWNRADDRVCPAEAKTFSLYCALEKATLQVTADFQHRGAAMQEARLVIEEVAPNRDYEHRLMNYNNDPTTTFADIQNVFRLLESRIAKRLKEKGSYVPERAAPRTAALPAGPPVTDADIRIAKRAREILDAPSKWNRADTQECPPNAAAFSLFCALQMAEKEVNGTSENRSAAFQEARIIIDETAPNRKRYNARLTDYNKDPATTFSEIQKLLQLVEERLVKRLSQQPPQVK